MNTPQEAHADQYRASRAYAETHPDMFGYCQRCLETRHESDLVTCYVCLEMFCKPPSNGWGACCDRNENGHLCRKCEFAL